VRSPRRAIAEPARPTRWPAERPGAALSHSARPACPRRPSPLGQPGHARRVAGQARPAVARGCL